MAKRTEGGKAYPNVGFHRLEFSGCGGASAGFLATGRYRHLCAADNDAWANATYQRNCGIVPEQLDLSLLAHADVERGRASAIPTRTRVVLFGGAPCQGFITAKMRATGTV